MRLDWQQGAYRQKRISGLFITSIACTDDNKRNNNGAGARR